MPHQTTSAREVFARAVISFRMRKNLSGNSVASAAGISRNTLHLIENKTANAQLETLARLAIALDVDPRAFFSGLEFPPPSMSLVETIRQTVADNIRTKRLELELSQNEIEMDLEMPRGYLGHIERSAPDLSLDVLERIGRRLKAPLETFFVP